MKYEIVDKLEGDCCQCDRLQFVKFLELDDLGQLWLFCSKTCLNASGSKGSKVVKL